MSGGTFDYNQYRISSIYEQMQEKLDNQGKEVSEHDLPNFNKEYLEKYPEEKFEPTYREDVQKVFKEGIKALKIAEIYTQRIDWYLAGDDNEDSLISRLKSDLEGLEQEKELSTDYGLSLSLLKVANCPNGNCDNDGTMALQVYPSGEWEPEPCEWCHHKKELIEKTQENDGT